MGDYKRKGFSIRLARALDQGSVCVYAEVESSNQDAWFREALAMQHCCRCPPEVTCAFQPWCRSWLEKT
jgi:hypothetical protein